jgi:uncharacterized protein YjiK
MKTLIIIAAIITLSGVFFGKEIKGAFAGTQPKKEKKAKKNKQESLAIPSDVTIIKKWELPSELLEVSGIAFLDKDRFACVQDELGIIYIFNTASGKIEKQIEFAGPGDFEGISLTGNTAYVVRADGQLFEVNMTSKKATEYKTGFTVDDNIESVCYDAKNNRLLLTGKEPDAGNSNSKAIYAFDIASKKMLPEPVFQVNLSDERLFAGNGKKNKVIMPSAIAIHPVTNDIYIADGPGARLVQLDSAAKLKKVYVLGKDFPKAEGISFNPDGTIYISNEGKKVAANILQVGLN